ncbi:lytic transglycosylase domain-containing protein [Sphingomonas sp. HF-S3]|uniref:Lytic transglycosylase domain-containing protein n=2 Tax=Sphingomonas rustica TaxID=3103142 RepID=A0ABV0B8I0_9SPHN
MNLRIIMAATLAAAPMPALAEDLDVAPPAVPAASSSAIALAAPALSAEAAPPTSHGAEIDARDGIPDQLDAEQRRQYRSVFMAIRTGRWSEATAQLDAMPAGPLHAIARAEIFTAKNSPKAELSPLMALLASAPDLPQAAQISRMASTRGATALPQLPAVQRLIWFDAAPVRKRTRSVRSDSAATEVALAMQPFIKADDGVSAEALIDRFSPDLTDESRTEWLQKTAWIYYVAGDDGNARRVAEKAERGSGAWAAPASWITGLAAWRQKDCEGAGRAFETVAQRADDVELRSAGLYWASRADMACGRPDRVAGHLNGAAQYGETFYGLLARQSLGIDEKPFPGNRAIAADWRRLESRPNVRVAAALIEIGETDLADEVLRHQAKLGDAQDHAALTRLAGRMNLPQTQLWLSHNGPAGARPLIEARYPAPNWAPAGGWRVDRNLVYAHTLQESRFNASVRSAAGAMGLMQVRTGAAIDVGRRRGVTYAASDLTKPSVNMEIGQSYLEQLRDSSMTGGLLPKVIAAYNAGPNPVQAWNAGMRDNGDPLLYIESIPYWETRGYVMIVLRNYWMYELQEGRRSTSRGALVEGMWPRFPGLPGAPAIRMPGRQQASRISAGPNANR